MGDRCLKLCQCGVNERKVVIGVITERLGIKILIQALKLNWLLSALLSFCTSEGWM